MLTFHPLTTNLLPDPLLRLIHIHRPTVNKVALTVPVLYLYSSTALWSRNFQPRSRISTFLQNFTKFGCGPLKIYISPLTGKLEEQQFTILNGTVNSTSSRQHRAINGHRLTFNQQFTARQTHLCTSQLCLIYILIIYHLYIIKM